MIKTFAYSLLEILENKRAVALSAVIVAVLIGAVFTISAYRNDSPNKDNEVLSAQKSATPNNRSTKTNSASDTKGDSNAQQTTPSQNPGSISSTLNSSTSSAGNTTPSSAAVPTSTVTKTTVNKDNTTTKEVVSTVPIPFSTQTQNEVNMQSGTSMLAQMGQNGTQTIVYSVIYDQNGKEISRKILSDTITKQPVAQITKVGVSDFNLNADTLEGTEFGEMCLPIDYDGAGDGCIGVPSNQHFSAVNISGVRYVSCISNMNNVCHNESVNLTTVIPISATNTFIYLGKTYRADPRAGGNMPEPLTIGICSKYGLACGSW